MTESVNSIDEVSDINAVDAEQLDQLVGRLLAIEWPVTVQRAEELLAEWGWTVEERVDDRSLVVDPGFGVDALDPGWFTFDDGPAENPELSKVAVAISDRSEGSDPATLRDIFAAQFAAVAARCGAPDERRSGADPLAVWLLPSDSQLVLYGPASTWASLTMSSPTHGRLLRDTD